MILATIMRALNEIARVGNDSNKAKVYFRKTRFMRFSRFLLIGVSLFFLKSYVLGQENFSVHYADPSFVPGFLNLCGEPDTVAVEIKTTGNDARTRRNIEAQLHLFKGVQFIELLPATSPGVLLVDPQNLLFEIPDLSPTNQSTVVIYFSIAANCDYLDTLKLDNRLRVFDVWDIRFDIGTTTGNSERYTTVEYRDAFAVPFFKLEIEPNTTPIRAGNCFERRLTVTNTSLAGIAKNLLYEIRQQTGTEVRTIRVNGISVPFSTKAINANTLVINVQIPNSAFQSNELVSGAMGNGDTLFDPNERLFITEEVCLLDCDEASDSDHAILWGCGGQICDRSEIKSTFRIGQGTPNILTRTSGSIPNRHAGYCATGSTTVTFTNNGVEIDPGFGGIYDIAAGIGMGSGFFTKSNGFEIKTLRIAGVEISPLTAFTELNRNNLFQVDPDGAGGLDDLDGDGFFDDLPIGRSFEITAFFEFDCGNAQSVSDSCFNDVGTNFNARLDYTNACAERIIQLESSYYRPSNANSTFENFTQPDAFLETDVFFVRHFESRGVRNFENNCTTGSEFIVTVILPKGIALVPAQTRFLKNGVTNFSLIRTNQQGDTLRLYYNASNTPFLNGDYDLNLAFRADCTADLGPTSFPLSLEYFCKDCQCSHLWYCGNVDGPWLHATHPPCPLDVLIDCRVGMQTTDFQVDRTTFGFADRNYTIPFPKGSANKKVAIPCDSVRMVVSNVVGKNELTDSIGVEISYENPDGTDNESEAFLYGNGQVRFVRQGVSIACPIEAGDIQHGSIGREKQLRIDLGRCLAQVGFSLSPGDSVIFEGNFAVNIAGPIPFQFRGVPKFRAYGYAILMGQEFWCDNFGENFTVGRSNTVFDFPTSQDFPKGCQETLLEYRLVTVNNGFRNFFGNEFRPAASVDSLVIHFDPAILDAFDRYDIEVSVPGHPVFGNAYYPIGSLSGFPQGKFVAHFDSLQFVPSLNEVQNYAFDLRIRLQPNCKSQKGSSNGDNRFRMNAEMYFRDRVYARTIGKGECLDLRRDTVAQHIVHSTPPKINFISLSEPNFILLGDTAIWRLQVCNTTPDAATGMTWIELNSPGNAIEITEIQDVTRSNTPIKLPLQNNGTSSSAFFAVGNGLAMANGQNVYEDICKVFLVKAIVKQCGFSELSAKAGWDCEQPGNPDWMPQENDLCPAQSISLSVSTRDPLLEAAVVDQPLANPDICDTTSITILLRNSDIGAVFNLNTEIILPTEGATLIPGSVEIAYPSGGPFRPALNDPVFNQQGGFGKIYEYLGFGAMHPYLENEGLPGFNPLNPSDSNEIRIRLRFVTDCDYLSGSLVYFNFQGIKGCGAPSNFEAGETKPIFIRGTEADSLKSFEILLSAGSRLISNTTSTIGLSVENLTTILTDSTDFFAITLPTGVNYLPGTIITILPTGWSFSEPVIETVNNQQTLRWSVPPGLGQNERLEIRFDVLSPHFTCETQNELVRLFTLSRRMLFCAVQATNCTVDVITSNNNGQLSDIAVGADLEFEFLSAESFCTESGESVQINARLRPLGFEFSGQKVSFNILHDQNSNGKADPGEPVLSKLSQQAPGKGTDWFPVLSFEVNAAQVCGLLLSIDTSGLPICEKQDFAVPIPRLINAGEDLAVCVAGNSATVALGDSLCLDNNYQFQWTALDNSPGQFIHQPDHGFTLIDLPVIATRSTLYPFELTTTRPGCGSSSDTVVVRISDAVRVSHAQNLVIQRGQTIQLIPSITGGTEPFSFEWHPTNSLDDPFSPQPNATPDSSTTYEVQVTDSSGCSSTVQILVLVIEPVDGTVKFDSAVICFGDSIALEAEGGDLYRWIPDPSNPGLGSLSDLFTQNPTFSGGIGGQSYRFQVIISDANFPQNADTLSVLIIVNPIPEALAGRDTTICAGSSATLRGGATGGSGNYQFTWIDGPSTHDWSISPTIGSDYVLIVEDSNSCRDEDTVHVEVTLCDCSILEERDTHWIQAAGCAGQAILCIPGDYQTIQQYSFTDNGVSYQGTLAPCAYDTLGLYSFQNLFAQGNFGPYRVTSWTVNGTTFSGVFLTLQELADQMNRWDPNGSWEFFQAALVIRGGANNQVYGSLMIEDANFGVRSVHPYSTSFPPNGFGLPLSVGNHQIIINDNLNKCADTVNVVATCTQTDTIRITLIEGNSDTLCLALNELPGEFSIMLNTCPPEKEIEWIALQDTCLAIKGLVPGMDTLCMIVCDDFGICDTTIIIITVIRQPGPVKIIRDTIAIGQRVIECCDTSDLNLKGIITSIENACPDLSGDQVHFDLNRVNFCVEYLGLDLGTDTACIVFCDDLGFCDTVLFIVTAVEGRVIYDTIYIQVDTVTYCFDPIKLPHQLSLIRDDCPALSGGIISFEIDTVDFCLTYSGDFIGTDTICIQIGDNGGNSVQYLFVITVRTTVPETICDTIYINETVTFCPDRSEFSSVTMQRIENFCPDEGGSAVEFITNTTTFCVEYSGIEIGRDSACIVLCDKNGVCDTTYLCIEVVEYLDPVVAVPDCDTTFSGEPVVIDVEANDTLFGRVFCPIIVEEPSLGNAVVNLDCTITYNSTQNNCDVTDYFVYRVCNENGCDTALVKVFVRCSEIVIFTAVSPNNDGMNDEFYIGGIEDKTENRLQIFNRWGNLVFEIEDYQNDWIGEWNGKQLPDGTYFFIFEVKDNGIDRTFRGYLELFR